jgi:hypothetical protein
MTDERPPDVRAYFDPFATVSVDTASLDDAIVPLGNGWWTRLRTFAGRVNPLGQTRETFDDVFGTALKHLHK